MTLFNFALIFFPLFGALLTAVAHGPHWIISASLGMPIGVLVKMAVNGVIK